MKTPKQIAYQRAYYAEHREELLVKQRAYKVVDMEHHKVVAKRWRDAHKDQIRENNAKWRAANLERSRAYARNYARVNAERLKPKAKIAVRAYSLRQYGLTPEDFRDMLVGQAGRCLICFRVPDKSLVVDHDHETGAIRGLLCNSCNRLLGIAQDSPARLNAAIRYLQVA